MSGKRATEQISFWIYCARELKGKFFHGVFKHLHNGHLFGKGAAIEFLLEGKARSRKMSFWGQLVKRRVLSSLIILIFAIMYITALIVEIV